MLEIYVTDKIKGRFKIDDLYWFEENGVHDWGGRPITENSIFKGEIMIVQWEIPGPSIWEKAQKENSLMLKQAREIWPGINEDTEVIGDLDIQKLEYTIMGLRGIETTELIRCDFVSLSGLKYNLWGYAPQHNTLVVGFTA